MGKPKTQEAAPQPIITGNQGGGGGSSYSSWTSGAPQAFAGFSKFAETGGFSPEDLANIRSRAVSPVQAVYANAQREVNRQRSLQGGYSPGFGVLQERMQRNMGQGISDQSIAAESDIAKLVQSGKLSGLQGMADTEARTAGGGSSGGGGEDNMPSALVPEKKKGFWGKLGSGLKKVGQIALPVAAGALTGGLAAPLTAGLTGAGASIGQKIAGGLGLPKVKT